MLANSTAVGIPIVVLFFNFILIIYAIFSNITGRIRAQDKAIASYIVVVSVFVCFIIFKTVFLETFVVDPVTLYINSALIISVVHFYIICSYVRKRDRRKGKRSG